MAASRSISPSKYSRIEETSDPRCYSETPVCEDPPSDCNLGGLLAILKAELNELNQALERQAQILRPITAPPSPITNASPEKGIAKEPEQSNVIYELRGDILGIQEMIQKLVDLTYRLQI